MAIEQPVALHGTFISGTDLSAVGSQYKCVKITAAHTVGVVAASTDPVVGVCQNKPAVGQEAVVMTLGISKAAAGAAVAAGAELMADATGRLITASAAAGANRVIAVALDAAAAAGEIMSVLLIGPIRMI